MAERYGFGAALGREPIGALLLDGEGRIERSNAGFRRLAGLDAELRGKPLREVLALSDHRLEAAVADTQRRGQKVSVSGIALGPAGAEARQRVDVDLYPQPGERGEKGGVLMVVRDPVGASTDRFESATADSTGLFYQAFLHSTNAMELTDREGFLVDVNPAFERIYGYRKDEVLGQRPNLVASGKTDRTLYARMWRDLVDPNLGSWSGEVINRDRQGTEHPVLLAISAIRAPDGTITHFLGVAVDLTERKAWERGAMHSERLASLGQLAAGVAHEINTPLANIMLIAESIRRRSTDPWTQGRVDSLLQQTESAARIVRGLLDFARRPEVRVGEVDLGDLVRNAVSFLKGKQSADVEVDVTIPEDPLIVRGDRDQLNQVVTNLLNNAYDALDRRDRAHIDVELSADSDWVHVRVSDNGPGVPPDVRPHLFEPFFTTKSEGKGTGLGLAICHGIVQSHGGTIDVESEPGERTTFDVRLPRLPSVPGP